MEIYIKNAVLLRANRAPRVEHSDEPRWRAEKQMWA